MSATYFEILNNIQIVYQPIIDLKNGHVTGEEAFCRNRDFESPIDVLDKIRSLDKVLTFDIDLHTLALSGHANTTRKKRVFLNTEQLSFAKGSVHRKALDALTKDLGLCAKDIVLEFCERDYGLDTDALYDALLDYRRAGYRLALDDVDTHQRQLPLLLSFDWDYIKVSSQMVRGIDKDADKRAMLKALLMVTRYKHSYLVAEGLETKAELETLIKLDVDFAQGYYVAKPGAAHAEISESVVKRIERTNHSRFLTKSDTMTPTHVGHILKNYKSLKQGLKCKEVHSFLNSNDYDSVCFLDSQLNIVGFITKQALNLTLSTKYGFSLYGDKPIEEIYNHKPLIVNYFTPVKQVLLSAMNRTDDHAYDDIIIADNGIYHGIVSMRDVIGVVSALDSQAATQLNPLTALPGNNIINNNIDRYLTSNESVLFIYIDLSDFKTYNDFYGFEKGDAVIRETADILRRQLLNRPEPSFIGHIGGDDFICMMEMDSENVMYQLTAKTILQDLISDFEAAKPRFYTQEDYQAGHILDAIGSDKYAASALININIACYFGRLSQFSSLDDFSGFIASIKRKSKEKDHSNYLIYAQHLDQMLELA